MHVSYGIQGFYRQYGIEPCCGICVHFVGTEHEKGRCEKKQQWMSPRDCCLVFERAAGADDAET